MKLKIVTKPNVRKSTFTCEQLNHRKIFVRMMALSHWLHFLSKSHVVFNVTRQSDGRGAICWLAICLGVTYKQPS